MITKNQKIQIIEENKDAAVAALNSILDSIYDINEAYLNEDGSLKKGLVSDEKVEFIIKDLKKDASMYENLRLKLLANDFKLSDVEIARIGLSFMYIELLLQKQVDNLLLVKKKSQDIMTDLLSNTNELVDFSKET